MKKRKIAVVSGSRAEYGLLSQLLHAIKNDPQLELQIIATGMHWSPEFGLTYQFIEQDGFHIDAKVEMLLSSDTSVGVAKSIGLGVIGLADALQRLGPDIVVVLGDRFEILAAAQVALMMKIPLAHIHGGEITEGAIDDAIRHAITKMAHMHFVAAEPYYKRVMQLGENPDHIFKVGSLALERISQMTFLSRDAWQNKFNFAFGKINFLVTYHPTTLKSSEDPHVVEALLCALDSFPEAKVVFTKANTDEAGRMINRKIEEYVGRHPERAVVFPSLGDVNYLSLLQFVDVVIGNSSSGVAEPACFSKPTVNIGARQAKRLRASSVIDCEGNKIEILSAINKALSSEFQATLSQIDSPYYCDDTANKIKNTLKEIDITKLLIKRFHDLDGV